MQNEIKLQKNPNKFVTILKMYKYQQSIFYLKIRQFKR